MGVEINHVTDAKISASYTPLRRDGPHATTWSFVAVSRRQDELSDERPRGRRGAQAGG